jgi:hypothetical protein
MRSRQAALFRSRIASRIAVLALTLGLLAQATVAWGQGLPQGLPDVPDPKPLTPAQEASIRDEMTALAGVLVNGGKSPNEAKLAANAVGICLGAAYGYDLARDLAEAVCGEVLDAFMIQPGTTRHDLTPADRAWIADKIQDWTSELSLVLDPPQVMAAQSTMQACLEGHIKRGEEHDESVRSCLLGLGPLLDQPALRRRLLEAVGKLP